MESIAVRQRLDDLIRAHGDDYASISRLLGRNPTYVQQFIKRGVPRRLSEEDRRRLAAHFNVPEQSLGGPEIRVGRAMPAAGRAARRADDFVQIAYYDVGASAGPGGFAEDMPAQPSLAFQARFIRELASGSLEALSVIRVQGDSMWPTLSDGDEILVDAHDAAERLRDGIYVLKVDDALLVKRLALNPIGRTLTIKSDNETYPSWPDCDPVTVTIIGRVIWVGRRLP